MQLFGNSGQKNKKVTAATASREFIEGRISGFYVAVISTRAHIIENVRSILFLYNILNIEVIQLSFDEVKESSRWNAFDIFIIDIGDRTDSEKIAEDVNRYIPIRATTILIGNNDSILFAEHLMKKGINFLLEDKQFENIPNILYLRSVTPPGSSLRTGSIVTFLGCKGGIGTSSLATHVIKNISKTTNYPILYIQGASTSRNADFLFETPIEKDGGFTKIDDSIQVKIEQDEEQWNYNYLKSGSFNITFIDQNMGINASQSYLESIVHLSNIIVIVINRDPYAIKVVKTILEEITRLAQKEVQILNKRFLVCLNDEKPFDKNSSLRDEDIEEFIGRPIDFTRKYIANGDRFKKAYTNTDIELISSSIIGSKVKEQTSHNSFSKLFKKKKLNKKIR